MALKTDETKLSPAPEIAPGNVPTLSRGQKVGMELNLYGGRVLPATFGEVVEMAQMMCKADAAIPKHLQNNPGACMAVIQRSLGWEMDPWAVATKTYIAKEGQPIAYEAQLIAAVIMKWAPIKERVIPYKFTGSGGELQCSILVHHAETGEEIIYQSPKKKDIKVQNSPLWAADEQQQIGYYTIRALCRRHFPGLLLGVYDREEVLAMRDITPKSERPVQNALIDDEDGEALSGEVIDPPKAAKVMEKEPTLADSYNQDEEAETATEEVQEEAAPEPEVEETIITPDLIAENMMKSIGSSADLKSLEAWQKDNLQAIKDLPKDLASKVRKAYSGKYIDLDGGM